MGKMTCSSHKCKQIVMKIQENISLKKYNTFGIDASAKYFASFTNVDELKESIEFIKLPTANCQLLYWVAAAIYYLQKILLD